MPRSRSTSKGRDQANRGAALSDEDASDLENGAAPARPSRKSASKDLDEEKLARVNGDVGDEGDEDDDEIDEDDDLEEDVFVVEAIKKHMIDEDGSLKFHVKWEGYEKKSDMTWEPEENLQESANEILAAYLATLGGREKIFEESQEAARGKKRGRTSSSTPNLLPKRSRKNLEHPAESTPPASTKKWSPPAGSWEDEIESIDACEDEGSGKLIVYLVWKNGQKTKHDTSVIYKKCPQKMLQFYERHVRIIREEAKQAD